MALYLIGSATLDQQVRADGSTQTALGGVVTYGGLTFARHGLHPHALFYYEAARLKQIADFYRSQGVVPHGVAAAAATTFTNHLSADGARLQALTAMAPPIGAAHPGAAWQSGDHVHLGPLHAEDVAVDVYPTLREVFVTLDVQGYVRAARLGPVVSSLAPLLQDALQAAAIVKADAAEWGLLCTHFGKTDAEMLHAFGIDEVVRTRGAAGGEVLMRAGASVPYGAAPISRLVDATGAGDVFFAAYLYHRHYRRASVARACKAAAEVAALQVSDHYIRRTTLDL